jgi:hypothetical protein
MDLRDYGQHVFKITGTNFLSPIFLCRSLGAHCVSTPFLLGSIGRSHSERPFFLFEWFDLRNSSGRLISFQMLLIFEDFVEAILQKNARSDQKLTVHSP